jgi:hypothetical protein
MSIYKIVGTMARVVSDDAGNRVERVYYGKYRLIRIPGIKPAAMGDEKYKIGFIRAIARMAKQLGFIEYQSEWVCNDSAINSAEAIQRLPSFDGYNGSDNFDLA